MKIGLKKKNKGDMAEVVTKEKKVLTPAEKKKRKKKIILGVVAV